MITTNRLGGNTWSISLCHNSRGLSEIEKNNGFQKPIYPCVVYNVVGMFACVKITKYVWQHNVE